MTVGAIFPVGTSDGGCPAAIAEILKTESSLEVHLLYGNQAAPGSADPLESVARIQAAVSQPAVTWAASQSVEPFDFAVTYEQVRRFVTGIAARQYSRIYIGITGATNPIVTSLFQTAMAYLPGQVIPVYVQGKTSVSVQRFIASEIRDRVVAEEALAIARSGQIRVGALLAEKLPPEGDWGFLQSALHALAQWDDFDYAASAISLSQVAASIPDRPLLSSLTDTVTRVAANASKMSAFAKALRGVDKFAQTALKPEWRIQVSEVGQLLVADVLANAQRRIIEGRFTDSVLRAYRAAECATQMGLFALGIHPSRPDAYRAAYERFPQLQPAVQVGHGTGPSPEPKAIAFHAGLKFLESAGQIDWHRIDEPLKKLCSLRNHTYLEHGYDRVEKQQAERCLDRAKSICEHLFKIDRPDLDTLCGRFELIF